MYSSSARSGKLSKTAQRIRAIQKGEPVPKTAIAKVISRWNHDVTKKFQERKAIRDEYRKYRDKLMAKFMGHNLCVLRKGFFLVPPYDTIWSSNQGGATVNQSQEDDIGGTFGFNVVADGTAYAGAGIGAFYRPMSNVPTGHFRPFMRYSFNYLDSANCCSTAHNDGYLHARVVSMDSNFNIVKWPPTTSPCSCGPME